MSDEYDLTTEEQIPETETSEEVPEWSFELNGRTFTPDNYTELEPYVRTLDWATQNPDRWEQLQEWERAGYVLPEPEPAPVPTREVDPWADPEDERFAALQAEMGELRSYLEERERIESRTVVDEGFESFRTKHSDLSDNDLQRITGVVRDHGLVASYISNEGFRPESVSDAFEAAYRISFPDASAREGARGVVRNIQSRRRAASVGGSSASTPRVSEAPSTPDQHFAAMVEEIRAATNDQ